MMSQTRRTSAIRWIAYLLILACYPLLPLVVARSAGASSSAPRLPATVSGLLLVVSIEAALFVLWFTAGWLFGRPKRADLLLPWKERGAPIARGAVDAVLLLIGLSLVASTAAFFATAVLRWSPETLEAWRPAVENLVSPAVLRQNPVYLLLATTVVSFGLAGFREELWRSAMLAGVRALWPRTLDQPGSRWAAVLGTALLFGLGHCVQGRGGVAVTTLLGAAFGAIMVRRRNLWEAVLAHGFYDAFNFLLLAFGT